ncbi:hypothetical protein WA026_021877 [Henosepilachna vigintioctopunctata]|uniref:Uncharacterized protein n=1 Tax=Henosepilachna vigintioctopunctata TaxID=420089 RepID=A0AAW1URD4_9CUCU
MVSLKQNIKIHKPKIKVQSILVNHNLFRTLFANKILNCAIDSFEALTDAILECRSRSFYIEIIECTENNHWFTDKLLEKIKIRDRVYRQTRRCRLDAELDVQFRKLKNEIIIRIKILKNEYFRKNWNKAGSDVRKQRKLMDGLIIPKRSNTIEYLTVNEDCVSDPITIVNELNRYFVSAVANLLKYKRNYFKR